MDRRSATFAPEVRGILLSLAVAGTALIVSLALVACIARLGGMFTAPWPAGVAFACTLLAAAWCALIRAAWLAASPHSLDGKWHLLIAVAPFCALVLLARVLTFYPLGEFATFLLWFAALAEEAITLGLFVPTIVRQEALAWLSGPKNLTPSAPPAEPSKAPLETSPARHSPVTQATPAEPEAAMQRAPLAVVEGDDPPHLAAEASEPAGPIEEEPPLELAPGVTQQLTRASEAGQDQVHGLVRATFATGQRHAYLHLGFCPPLPSVPNVELHQLEGPEVQIKTGQVLTSGVRFDLKLRETAEVEQSAVFEFLATSKMASGETRLRAAG